MRQPRPFHAQSTAACIVALLLIPVPLFSQGISRGEIAGTVRDPSDTVVPGSQITITNVRTGLSRTTTTNESGIYVVTSLPVGTYRIECEAPGFSRTVLDDVTLDADQRLGVNIVLEVGEITETVEVVGGAPVLQSETGEVASLVSGVQVSEMPINGRNWSQFLVLGAGVVATNTDERGIGQEGNPLLAVHGARTDKVRYAIDGIQNMDTGGQRGVNNFPPPEAIAEIKVLKSNFRAESGSYGAGVANVVTKAGGREFHGQLYEFIRNDAMDAANFFATEAAPLKLNHFGGTLGGPFFIPGRYNADRTKDFFFFSQSVYRRRGPSLVGTTFLARTPTVAMRQGDFTGESTIVDPETGEPFPNNRIPADRIDPNATILLDNFFPLPNRSGSQNWIAQPSQATNHHQEMIRWDHHFTDRARLMARYMQDDWSQQQATALWSPMSFDTIGSQYHKPGTNLVTSLTNIISSTIVNDFTFGFSWNTIERPALGVEERPPDLDIPELFPGNPGNKIPDIVLGQGWGSISGSNVPYNNGNPMLSFREDLSMQRGNHSLKFGFEILRMRKWVDSHARPQGAFNFNGSATGHAVADFLLGEAFTYTEQEGGNLRRNWLSWQYDFYAQDDWKVRPNLTFNYGLRYSIFRSGHTGREDDGLFSIWLPDFYDPANAVELLPDAEIVPDSGDLLNGVVTPEQSTDATGGFDLYQTRYNHFAPRVGFAYSPWTKTVVRGGAGIYYGPGHVGREGYGLQPPFAQRVQLFNAELSNPGGGTARLFPSNIGSQDVEGKAATSYQWSVGIQREILPRTLFEISYVGNRGVHLYYTRNLNKPEPDATRQGGINLHRPFPGWGNITYVEPSAFSAYNALEVHLKRRLQSGWMFETSYTYSKAMGHADNFGNQGQDPRNQRAEWSFQGFDRTHVFVSNFLYELPFLRQQDTLLEKIVGGWSVGGIATFASGMMRTVGVSGDPHNVGGGPTRPDLIGDPNDGPKTLGEWFNTAAFVAPTPGVFGNAAPRIVRLPGLNNWDLAIYKNTPLRGDVRLQIRVELFNAFNHPQWGGVALNLNSPIFGEVTSAHDPRIIQIGVKLDF